MIIIKATYIYDFRHMLYTNSITPVVVSETTTTTSTTSTPGIREFEVDESLPITSLQIRLGDGTRYLVVFIRYC